MKSFPLPLTASEEQYYLQKYIEGDLNAKHILIEHNLRLVAHIVKKYQANVEEAEDLLSIGTIGLIKAVVTFDPEKNVRLGTYAARCIENEILMHLRARKKTSREVSLYEPIGTDREGNEIQLFDVIETDDQEAHRKIEEKDDILKLYQHVESKLSTRERLVLKMRYGLYNDIHSAKSQSFLASPAPMYPESKRALLKSCVGIFNTCAVFFFPVLY